MAKIITLANREVRIAPLTFRQLDALKDEIDLLMSPTGLNFARSEARAAVVQVVRASAQAAGDTITDDELLDGLTIVNFADVARSVFDRNGFLAKEGDTGEATAAASPT